MTDQTSIQTSKTLYIAYMTGSTIAGVDVGGFLRLHDLAPIALQGV
jgi:hypothetical protein